MAMLDFHLVYSSNFYSSEERFVEWFKMSCHQLQSCSDQPPPSPPSFISSIFSNILCNFFEVLAI
jgi:hypothetical protein